jgi:hypothetical protein
VRISLWDLHLVWFGLGVRSKLKNGAKIDIYWFWSSILILLIFYFLFYGTESYCESNCEKILKIWRSVVEIFNFLVIFWLKIDFFRFWWSILIFLILNFLFYGTKSYCESYCVKIRKIGCSVVEILKFLCIFLGKNWLCSILMIVIGHIN